MRIDVNAAIGRFPFRAHPAGTADQLADAMAANGIDEAWVSNLSAVHWRDPSAGNAELFEQLGPHPSLRPVPSLNPGFPGVAQVLDEAVAAGAVALRVDPTVAGVDPTGRAMIDLAAAAGERSLPLLLTVKLEDVRQRHPSDRAPALDPSMVRALVRAAPRARFLIVAADRGFVEQVHWGSTVAEAERILWEISWIWGPPEDDLDHLVRSIGAERFCFGTGYPLRIVESSGVKLELTPLTPAQRARIDVENARAFAGSRR